MKGRLSTSHLAKPRLQSILFVVVVIVVVVVAVYVLLPYHPHTTSLPHRPLIGIVSPGAVDNAANQNLTYSTTYNISVYGISKSSIAKGANLVFYNETNDSLLITISSLEFNSNSTASFYINELFRNMSNTKNIFNVTNESVNSSFESFNFTYLLRNQSKGYFLDAFGRSGSLVFTIEDVGIPLLSDASLIHQEAGALEFYH